MKNNILRSFLAGAAAVLVALPALSAPAPAAAQSVVSIQCAFYRDLTVGSAGSDVDCLHRYLNTFGYAGSGSIFTTQTRASVAAWQATNGIFPAAGYFGTVSRARYAQLVTVVPPPTFPPYYPPTTPTTPSYSSKELQALEKMREAKDLIDETWDDYSDAVDDGDSVGSAARLLEEAEDRLFDAMYAFLDRDYDDAVDFAEDAIDDAEDAEDDIDGRSGSGSRSDAREAIEDADDAIESARTTIRNAERNGADVDDAEDTLEDAEDALEDAEDAYDDGDYDDAEDYANDAEDLAEDAVDDIDY